MNLLENEENKSKKNDSKILTIALVSLIILILAAVGILSFSSYLKSKEFKFYVDGNTKTISNNLFIFEDEELYVSIKDITSVIKGYEFNNGDYKKYNEDENKCYVESPFEVAGFEADSEQVYKMVMQDNEYEYFTLKTKVKKIDGKLYTTAEGIELGFNVKFVYNKNKNYVAISTLDQIVKDYSKQFSKNKTISSENLSFSNKKALKYNLMLIQNSAGLYGVQRTDNLETTLGTKYLNLKFMESSKDFIATTPEKKQGILSVSGGTDIDPQYDEIKQLDIDYNLYIVKIGEKYGVINRKQTGKYIIYPEYDWVGIESTNFPKENIVNTYILYDNCIPVKKIETVEDKKVEKWIIFDKEGNKLSQNTFDGLGFVQGTSKNAQANNLLLIPDVEGIIVYKDSKYGVINSARKRIITYKFKTNICNN